MEGRFRCFRSGDSPEMKKKIPAFKTKAEERRFWLAHSSVDCFDWSDAQEVVLPRLKPSTKTISLRLPEPMVDELKLLANKRDVPYQSLLKVFCLSGPIWNFAMRAGRRVGK